MRTLAALALACASFRPAPPQEPRAAAWKVGIAQIRLEEELSENLTTVLRYIRRAAEEGCRVAVFPEGALRGVSKDEPADVDRALAEIRKAAASAGLYVLLGGKTARPAQGRPRNWMAAVDPSGRDLLRYEKLYDTPTAEMPRAFSIDGASCNAMICADRWLRGVEELPIMEGAGVSFELSNNYECEWVPALEWYWYVPRALRNGVYVVFANSAGPGKHGHSAVIAPDGSIVAAAGAEERLLTATIDPARANRAEAARRQRHPLLSPFWETGLRLLGGRPERVEPVSPCSSPEVEVRLATAQMACSREIAANLETMAAMIREAAESGADAVVFPELAVTGALEEDVLRAGEPALAGALERIRDAARGSKIAVVFGMPWQEGARRHNSAFALGPDGAVLTRSDELAPDRPELFAPGSGARGMWFRVKGVPAVVTVGRDALWSEISELTSLAGAQLRFHLSYDPATGEQASLRRLQVWANLASFGTFTATVNAASPEGLRSPSAPADGGSALWEDLQGRAESKLATQGGRRPGHDRMAIYSPFSANCLERAESRPRLLAATQRVNRTNPHRSAGKNPHMAPWYAEGARLLAPGPGF
jgi:predicted amidohydrolase